MAPSTPLLGLAAAASLALLAPPAGACTPARAGASVAAQPEAWRRAVAELVAASASQGSLWSCTGGVVDLVVREGGATLTVVTDDGHQIAREIASPDDVAPLGEALLARPLPDVVPGPVIAPPKDQVDPPAVPVEAAPRALVSVLLAPRYAGRSNIVWGGVTAAGSIPFLGLWAAGAWLRYDGPAVVLDKQGGALSELCFGVSGGRTIPFKHLELRANLLASVAVVSRSKGMDQGKPSGMMGAGPMFGGDSRVDGRVGAELRSVIPVSRLFRAVVAADAELAPRGIGGDEHVEHQVSPFPAYTLGLGVGLEFAPR